MKIQETIVLFILLFTTAKLSAQLPEKVGGLISRDRDIADMSKLQDPREAFLTMVDKESVFYVPSAVNAINYLNNRPNLPDILTWNPNFALVSRSLDWGVTSGPMQFQKSGAIKRYGQYVTVWKRDRKGVWRAQLRAEVENYGKGTPASMQYFEPDDKGYLKHRSKVRLGQREEIIMQTDKLFSTVLKADTRTGYSEFMADDVRFYFPWQPETIGRDDVIELLTKQRIEIDTEPETVGRAYSGEFAYSQGTATVGVKDKVLKFSYIRIWERKNDFQWKVILEMLFER